MKWWEYPVLGLWFWVRVRDMRKCIKRLKSMGQTFDPAEKDVTLAIRFIELAIARYDAAWNALKTAK